jgi:hypothetical protein
MQIGIRKPFKLFTDKQNIVDGAKMKHERGEMKDDKAHKRRKRV